jgi:cellulose synthase/poly-beta-1,6-N-acetylglucosamine synthase-like glycosyltransferase
VGRNSKLHFINFNGTAGVWRKQCILDAGNWESDTLTEDLDLSYRAQLRNSNILKMWLPAELPAIISATRSPQFRWNKGGAENFSKNAARVLNQSLLD